MAGIGFKLRQAFERDTYLDNIRATAFSSTIAGGPIFFSILCLILLGIFSSAFISSDEMRVFVVTVVYVFAFSLISTGISQLLITRCLSDFIYVNEIQRILPTFSSVLALTILTQLIIGLPFFFIWEMDVLYKLTALMLFITVGCLWQLMVFLSAVKNYKIIAAAFVLGLIISFVLALYLGRKGGLTGFLHGYTIGHLVLLLILVGRLFIEFKSNEKPELAFIRYFKKMPELLLIGFCYYAGIWIDKIIFWFSPEGEQVSSFLYMYSDYDVATFFAFLTVLPSYTYFLVKVETDFYQRFRSFFRSVLNNGTFKEISTQKKRLATSAKESLFGLVKLQGTITLLCLLFARDLAAFFHIPVLGTLILEKALIAVFLQMLLLTVMIFMMYFDMKSQLVFVTGVFLSANILFTLLSLNFGYIYYGYGYLVACLLSLVFWLYPPQPPRLEPGIPHLCQPAAGWKVGARHAVPLRKTRIIQTFAISAVNYSDNPE